MEFTVTCQDTMFDTLKYSYTIAITQVKGTLQIGDNPVTVTATNLDIDTYTFTAATAEKYTFTAPAGLTVKVPEKDVTINPGSSGVVNLDADETVIVVVSGAVNSYTLGISAGESYDSLPNGTKVAYAKGEVKTYSVPSDVVTAAGTYKITVVMAAPNTVPVLFALNAEDKDYATLYGSSATDGTADIVYGGYNQFYKKDDSRFTCTSQMATFNIQLTLKPGDTLTFVNGYGYGACNLTITVAAV